MKAIVMSPENGVPQYLENFPEPVPADSEILISVKAAAIKHLDKSRASGKHYSTRDDSRQVKVIGGDGVGVLADGTRVFALGNGMLAGKAVIKKDQFVKIPAGIDDATAAALPNAVAGSAMAIRFRADMKKGESVLINGATGFTGKIAVQLAKYYGAGHVIATGRDEASLQTLLALGADEVISLKQDGTALVAQLKAIHQHRPIDVILDYLWGTSAQSILQSLMGTGRFSHKTRFVSIGSISGDKIELSAEVLRSVDLHLLGSGLGSWTKSEFDTLFKDILPQMLQLAADNQLKVDTTTVKLSEIENLWDKDIQGGQRLVALM